MAKFYLKEFRDDVVTAARQGWMSLRESARVRGHNEADE